MVWFCFYIYEYKILEFTNSITFVKYRTYIVEFA